MTIFDFIQKLIRSKNLTIPILVAFTGVLALAALKVDPIFIVGGLIGLVVGAILLSFPFACVPIYYMLLYLRPGDMYPQLEKLRLILLIVFVMTASFLLRVLVFKTLRVLRNPQMLFILGVLLAIALSIIGSFYRSISLERFFDMTRILVMVILVAHIVDSFKRLKIMSWSILIALSILATMNFIQWILGQKVVDNGGSGGMAGGFLGDGNDFALALNVMLPLAVFQFLSAKKFLMKLAFAAVALSFIASVVATYSRGGFLGTIAVFLMAFWFYLWRTKQWGKGIFIIFTVVVIGTVAIMALAPDSFKERIGGMHEYDQDESALGRLDAWSAGGRMLADNPLFGVGAGAFSEAYGRKYKPFDAIAANWREAHSLYVQCAGELGIVGLFFVAGLCFFMFKDQRKIHNYGVADPELQRQLYFFADALTAGLVGFLVSGAFLSVLYYPHLYILSTMTMILLRITQDASKLSPNELADAN